MSPQKFVKINKLKKRRGNGKDIIKRNQHKTSDGEFIFELLNEYELSPKESESILESAKRCLIREKCLKEGEIEV